MVVAYRLGVLIAGSRHLCCGASDACLFKQLGHDFERMPEVLVGLHFLVFVMLMLSKAAMLLASGASSSNALVIF